MTNSTLFYSNIPLLSLFLPLLYFSLSPSIQTGYKVKMIKRKYKRQKKKKRTNRVFKVNNVPGLLRTTNFRPACSLSPLTNSQLPRIAITKTTTSHAFCTKIESGSLTMLIFHGILCLLRRKMSSTYLFTSACQQWLMLLSFWGVLITYLWVRLATMMWKQ